MRQILCIIVALLLVAGRGSADAAERRVDAAGPFSRTLQSSAATADRFARLHNKAAATGTVRVIVGLRVPFAAEGKLAPSEVRRQRREIAGAQNRLVSVLPEASGRHLRDFSTLPFVAMDVTPQDLVRLAADPTVQTITEDRLNKPLLAQSVPMIRGDAAWAAGYRGLGETVAILDTGVDKAHPFLFGKVVSEACYSRGGWCPGGATSSIETGSGRPCPFSECTHGTHVAGIAAGSGWSFSGVAKDSRLIAIQVFSPVGKEARAFDSDIIAGLERVYALKDIYRIAAVNMSLGSGSYTTNCDAYNPAMTAAIDQLRADGIATVIASGNEYGIDAIAYPACISTAVSVGSVSDAAWGDCAGQATAADMVACYSNSAPILSLLAPGSLITSSVPNRKYAAYHGTSMAAPHVAGAWAVLKEKAPRASVSTILSALERTGVPVTDYRNGLTKPRIDVMGALGELDDPRKAVVYVPAGTALGTVGFSPTGTVASCRRDCFNRFATNTQVTLTATPDAGARFYGWGGACSGQGTCALSMSTARTVYAGFYTGSLLPLNLTRTGAGGGTVAFWSSGFTANCAGSCAQSYWKNATVWLTAIPAAGSYFKGWTGVCRGQKDYCVVRVSSAKSVTATFEVLPSYELRFVKQGSGAGTLAFGDGQTASCTSSCTRSFLAGTELTLSVQPDAGSQFVGWGGICQGPKSTCLTTIKGPISVSAEFRLQEASTAAR